MSINDPGSKKIKSLDVDQATSGANGTYIALLGLRDNVYPRYICTHSADMHWFRQPSTTVWGLQALLHLCGAWEGQAGLIKMSSADTREWLYGRYGTQQASRSGTVEIPYRANGTANRTNKMDLWRRVR